MDNMFITGITAVTALVATVINLIVGIGSIKKSKETIREENYYNKVLQPYIKYLHESHKWEDDALKVFDEVNINEPFVPPYVRHVYYSNDKKRNEQLKKLLVIDYVKLYENEDRALNRFLKVFGRFSKIFMSFYTAVFLLLDVFVVAVLISYIVEHIKIKSFDILDLFAVLLVGSIYAGGTILMFLSLKLIMADKDMYSTKQDKINNQIKNLDSEFMKISSKNYY